MGIFDNLILAGGINRSEFPFDVSKNSDGEYRWWQTDGLNPSMDMYGILPQSEIGSSDLVQGSEDKFYLCRRSPPVIKWTDVNEGLLLTEDEDIISGADHWRTVRYSGTIDISAVTEGGKAYDASVEIERGVFQSITVEDPYNLYEDSLKPDN
jgi:hypothetical protein